MAFRIKKLLRPRNQSLDQFQNNLRKGRDRVLYEQPLFGLYHTFFKLQPHQAVGTAVPLNSKTQIKHLLSRVVNITLGQLTSTVLC